MDLRGILVRTVAPKVSTVLSTPRPMDLPKAITIPIFYCLNTRSLFYCLNTKKALLFFRASQVNPPAKHKTQV